MQDAITVGHPFEFPTQVVLVDDDRDFLDGISLMLEGDFSHRLFSSASAALDCVNVAHHHTGILTRCYSLYRTGPMASDALTHVDIARLCQEVANPDRFNTVSTVVVDYSMPEMNGLEFLASLKNPFVKKILLTGRGDMELAVKAFNNQLIDQFIDKHDPQLKMRLNTAIAAFHDQYFRSSFKLVTDQILTGNHDGFLTCPAFQSWFSGIRRKLGIVEYYLTDEPCPGFLLANARGDCHAMLIHTDESLREHRNRIAQLNAPPSLLECLDQHAVVPLRDDIQDSLEPGSESLANWQQHYVAATSIASSTRYHVATTAVENTYPSAAQDLLSFITFLQQLLPASEILH